MIGHFRKCLFYAIAASARQLLPALLYLLHPCSRPCSATAMDGGSAENAGCNFLSFLLSHKKSYFRKYPIVAVLLLNVVFLQSSFAFEWDEDMRDQPSIKAQETQVTTNPSSIPQSGKEPVFPPEDMSELVQARLHAGQLQNPIPKSGESLNLGKVAYDLHCAVCHGEQGHGDGKVGKKYVPDPMNLTIDYVQIQPEGQLFYTISHGSIAMPYYRDVIPVTDRWHIVNYIKSVLGKKPE